MFETRAPKGPLEPPAFHAAFDATAEEREGLAPEALLPVNVDSQVVFKTVIGALPRLRTLRADISALPSFDIACFDRLERYAFALSYAHVSVRAASAETDALPALRERAMALRALLLSDVHALALRGLIDEHRLDRLKRTTGYLGLSADLGMLAIVLRDSWDVIASKTALQLAEVDEAEGLSERLMRGYAQRRPTSPALARAIDQRQRAFTLLVRAYGEARRAVTYLRAGSGDADTFAPSPWAGRRGRRRRATPAVVASPVVSLPLRAVATPARAPSVAPTAPAGASALSPLRRVDMDRVEPSLPRASDVVVSESLANELGAPPSLPRIRIDG